MYLEEHQYLDWRTNAGNPGPLKPDKAQTSMIAPPAAAIGIIHEPAIGQTPEEQTKQLLQLAWLNARPPYLTYQEAQ